MSLTQRWSTPPWLGSSLIFLVIFFGLYGLYLWYEPYHIYYFSFLATTVCAVMNPFDGAISCSENLIYHHGVAELKVVEGCDGVSMLILLTAAIAAFPASLRHKLYGLAIALPALLLINWLRLIVLAYLRFYLEGYFGLFHVYFFQPLMIFITFACFLAWLHFQTPRADAEGAPHVAS